MAVLTESHLPLLGLMHCTLLLNQSKKLFLATLLVFLDDLEQLLNGNCFGTVEWMQARFLYSI